MQHTRAYALRDGIDADLFGGSVTNRDGTTFDVAAALAEGGGQIVTDDPSLIDALDTYEPLKHVTVPEEARGYDAMSKDELIGVANDQGIELPERATKEQIKSTLVAADHEGVS